MIVNSDSTDTTMDISHVSIEGTLAVCDSMAGHTGVWVTWIDDSGSVGMDLGTLVDLMRGPLPPSKVRYGEISLDPN